MKRLLRTSLLSLMIFLIPSLSYSQAYQADDLLQTILGGPPSAPFWFFDDTDFVLTTHADKTKRGNFSLSLLPTLANRTWSFKNASYQVAGSDLDNLFTAKQTFNIQPGSTSPVIETATTVTSGLAGGIGTGIWNLTPVLSNAGDDVGAVTGIRTNINIDQATDASYRGMNVVMDVASDGASQTGSTTLTGLDFIVRTSGTSSSGQISALRGILGAAQHNAVGGDDLTSLTASDMQLSSGVGSGGVTTANGIRFSSITIRSLWNELYEFRGINPTMSGGTLLNLYGLYLPNLTAATTNWAIYSLGGNSSHLGPFKFGANTAPTHRLDIAAGTSTIAPIKFTSATPISTPVAGCMEFQTDDYFATITTGAARKAFVLDDGTRLTLNRIPIAGVNGRLADDTDLTFSSDRLTATKLTSTLVTHTPGSDPGSPAEGDVWNNSTQKSLYTYADGVKQALVGNIFSQTNTITVTNTTTEVNLVGSGVGTVTLPANFFTVGKTLRVTMRGTFNVDAVNSGFRVRSYLGGVGGTVVGDTGPGNTVADIVVPGIFEIVHDITCRTTGATGTVASSGRFSHTQNSGAISSLVTMTFLNAGTVTVDTTVAKDYAISAQWTTADVDNIIESQITTIEVLN